MTANDLKTFFKEHLVPAKLYDLKGAKSNRLCLEHVKDGWNVYFAEKKDKVGLMHFASEADACQTMKEEMRKIMAAIYGLTWSRI
jgi:hypothetical protein